MDYVYILFDEDAADISSSFGSICSSYEDAKNVQKAIESDICCQYYSILKVPVNVALSGEGILKDHYRIEGKCEEIV